MYSFTIENSLISVFALSCSSEFEEGKKYNHFKVNVLSYMHFGNVEIMLSLFFFFLDLKERIFSHERES